MAKSTTKKTSSAKKAASKATAARSTKASAAKAKTPIKSKVSTSSAPVSSVSSKAKAASSAIKAAPKPVIVQTTSPNVSSPALKKKELIDTVTERSGVKRRDVKPAIEALLAILGQTLSEGREINLQPLGKIKVNRQKDIQGGKVLIAKVRQSDRSPAPKDPLAKAAE